MYFGSVKCMVISILNHVGSIPWNQPVSKTIAAVSFYFFQTELYEMLCVVSLKPIMQINEVKKKYKQIIEHFLSIPKSVVGRTTVSCVTS